MLKLPLSRSPQELVQRRLFRLAALFLFCASLALTFAPLIRMHTWQTEIRWQHWIGYAIWLLAFSILQRISERQNAERDPYVLPIVGLLTGWGLLTIFRLSATDGFKQTLWMALCVLMLAGGMRSRGLLQILRRYKYIWLTIALVLALLTFLFGTNPSGIGPNLWLGFSGIYLQPSEILKLVLIIYLSAYLADKVSVRMNFLSLLIPTILVAGISLLILVIQRDLGTASLFIALYTIIIFLATGKRRFLLASTLVIVAALVAGYFTFDVIQLRVEGWLNPWLDPNGRSYQIVQSIIAIANGGIFGRGIGLGSPGVVPVAQSDFIFPAILEESGLLGGVAVVFLTATLALRGFIISLKSSNQFQRFLAAGISTYLAAQALLIMGGTIRLFPLTGVTLPFISYGGSSLVTAFFAILLLLTISNQPTDEIAPVSHPKAYFFTGSAILIGFIAVTLVITWWSVFKADALLSRNDNPRRFISDQYVERGRILDRNNTVIAETIGEAGNLSRVLHYPSLSAIVGYSDSNYGQGGLEAELDSVLRGVQGNSVENVFFTRLLTAQYPQGADVRLSLDIRLQNMADGLLEDKTGAIVMLNAVSGEIQVMATSPTFDANQLSENWETWKTDETSPLVNRAIQGRYPLGNAAGGLLMARLLSSQSLPPMPADLTWTANIGDSHYCSVNPGSLTSWGNLVSAGCNQSMQMLIYYLGPEEIQEIFNKVGFFEDNEKLFSEPSPIEASIDFRSDNDLLVSPLQVAVAYAALSNQGIKISPQLAMAFQYPGQDWTLFENQSIPQNLTILNAGSATQLLKNATIPGWSLVSTSITQTGTLDWYISGTYSQWQGTPIILVVALEDASPMIARNIGNAMFNSTVNAIQ